MQREAGPQQREIAIQRAILVYLGGQGDVLAWRNNVGFTKNDGRGVRYGLARGSADIVGIGPGGVFFAIEVKTPRGRPTPEQVAWLRKVVEYGGAAAVVRSVEQAELLVEEMRARLRVRGT